MSIHATATILEFSILLLFMHRDLHFIIIYLFVYLSCVSSGLTLPEGKDFVLCVFLGTFYLTSACYNIIIHTQ